MKITSGWYLYSRGRMPTVQVVITCTQLIASLGLWREYSYKLYLRIAGGYRVSFGDGKTVWPAVRNGCPPVDLGAQTDLRRIVGQAVGHQTTSHLNSISTDLLHHQYCQVIWPGLPIPATRLCVTTATDGRHEPASRAGIYPRPNRPTSPRPACRSASPTPTTLTPVSVLQAIHPPSAP